MTTVLNMDKSALMTALQALQPAFDTTDMSVGLMRFNGLDAFSNLLSVSRTQVVLTTEAEDTGYYAVLKGRDLGYSLSTGTPTGSASSISLYEGATYNSTTKVVSGGHVAAKLELTDKDYTFTIYDEETTDIAFKITVSGTGLPTSIAQASKLIGYDLVTGQDIRNSGSIAVTGFSITNVAGGGTIVFDSQKSLTITVPPSVDNGTDGYRLTIAGKFPLSLSANQISGLVKGTLDPLSLLTQRVTSITVVNTGETGTESTAIAKIVDIPSTLTAAEIYDIMQTGDYTSLLGDGSTVNLDDTATDVEGFELSDYFSTLGDLSGKSFTFMGTDGMNSLIGTAGRDTIYAGKGDDDFYGRGGDDYLDGGAGNDRISGEDGDDTLVGATGDEDELSGGLGNDTYLAFSGNTLFEEVDAGIDTVKVTTSWTLDENFENLVFTGTGAFTGTGNDEDNEITGGRQSDTLVGGAGNDTLTGGAGSDIMSGGADDDTYIVDAAGDFLTEEEDAGADTVRSAVSWTLGANFENLVYTGSAAFVGTGNALDNDISGGVRGDTLTGGDGDDTLTGGAGDDTLNGGTGDDTLVGGTGNDIYVVDSADDVVTEESNSGIDTIRTTLSEWVLDSSMENLTSTGSGDFAGWGNASANILIAAGGNDTLNGGAGADRMAAGTGDDTYVVDHARDVITEGRNAGIDTVISSVSYTLAENIENLNADYDDLTVFTGAGNNLNNEITGGSARDTLLGYGGNDLLYGLAGNDTLQGDAGNDTLDGGDGNDTLKGGVGNDLYVVNSTSDVVVEGKNAGTDTVQTNVNWTLGANVEKLMFTGEGDFIGTGNDLNNTIIGGDGNDTLNGGGGLDTLSGGAGDDIYIVDMARDAIAESENGGTDTVRTAVNWTLGDDLENLTYTGTKAFVGVGNGLNNIITGGKGNDTLRGEAGDDELMGGAGNDALYGGAGHDELTGGAGNDLLYGGEGNDTYHVGRGLGADTITNADAVGSDAVSFGEDVSKEQLWFKQSGNNLIVQVIGTKDQVTLAGWYSNDANKVAYFEASDGDRLVKSQVDQLVQAMASMTAPSLGQLNLSEAALENLSPTLTATWMNRA